MNIESEIAKAKQLLLSGQFEQAKSICQKVLKRNRRNIDAAHILGTVYVIEKKYREAEKLLKEVIAANPTHIHALNNLGVLCYNLEEMDKAEYYYKKVIEINPRHEDSLTNLGGVYFKQNKCSEAAECYRRALELAPQKTGLMTSLGVALCTMGNIDEGVSWYRKALESVPDDPVVLGNLLRALFIQGKRSEAVDLINKILALPAPGNALFPAYSIAKQLGLWSSGSRSEPAVLKEIFNGHVSVPDIQAVSMMLLGTENIGNEMLLKVHRVLGGRIENERISQPFSAYGKAMKSCDRLRIGYISPDFRAHVVSSFIRGLINLYDRSRFEVHCYSSVPRADETTEQYRQTVDGFVDISGMTDSEAAKRIHDDGIHILIDLAGHTQGNRISVLAYRPAPIQMTYLGYPYTSGMSTIDYIIADPYLAGEKYSAYCTEKPLLLAQSAFCIGDFAEQKINPVVPFDRNGHVTFGTLINPYKVHPTAVRVWSRILHQLPESRLILNHPNWEAEVARAEVKSEFARHGIPESRIDMVWCRHPEGGIHLRYYNDLDIALDSFPMTGGVTSMEALWMSVPVVTWVGESHSERITYSILKNLPIPTDDLIAFSENEYVERAVALARNPDRIRELHQAIPESLKHSVLTDPILFARHMEAAYVEAWNSKFPDLRMQETKQDKPVMYVPAAGEVELAVSDSLEDVYGYVLREQEGWYDPEYGFVLKAIQPGNSVIDVGAAVGMYAVPLAKKVGPATMLRAMTTPGAMYAYLNLSKRHNQLENLRIVQAPGHDVKMDDTESDWTHLDFVRLSPETNDGKGGFAEKWRGVFVDASPLVMFAIRRGAEIDLSVAQAFVELGYGLYRLIPGLGALAPFGNQDELDALALNLFACKPERAAILERQGILMREFQPLAGFPVAGKNLWRDYLAQKPYAAALLLASPDASADQWSDVYRTALDLFVEFKNRDLPLAQRYASLEMACSTMAPLIATAPSFVRLMTFARIADEIGKRELAVTLLNRLDNMMASGASVQLDEPFLAVSDYFESLNPGERLPDWIVTSVREQRERRRAFSSYFTGKESLAVLLPLQGAGFLSEDMQRRIRLIQARYA